MSTWIGLPMTSECISHIKQTSSTTTSQPARTDTSLPCCIFVVNRVVRMHTLLYPACVWPTHSPVSATAEGESTSIGAPVSASPAAGLLHEPPALAPSGCCCRVYRWAPAVPGDRAGQGKQYVLVGNHAELAHPGSTMSLCGVALHHLWALKAALYMALEVLTPTHSGHPTTCGGTDTTAEGRVLQAQHAQAAQARALLSVQLAYLRGAGWFVLAPPH
jgi:hypothetical protein